MGNKVKITVRKLSPGFNFENSFEMIKSEFLNYIASELAGKSSPKLVKEESSICSKIDDDTIKAKVINNLIKKTGWKSQKVANYIMNLYNLNKAAAFSTILKEIAIELDKKYEDHINNCKELFVISMMDGRIYKVPRAHVKNFRNFAAFRTEEDAKIACRILRDDLKEMFKGGGK